MPAPIPVVTPIADLLAPPAGGTVALSCSASTVGPGASYQWQLIEQPVGGSAALTNATTAAPTLTGVTLRGTYIVFLTITDSGGSSHAYPYPTQATTAPYGFTSPLATAFGVVRVAEESGLFKPGRGEYGWFEKGLWPLIDRVNDGLTFNRYNDPTRTLTANAIVPDLTVTPNDLIVSVAGLNIRNDTAQLEHEIYSPTHDKINVLSNVAVTGKNLTVSGGIIRTDEVRDSSGGNLLLAPNANLTVTAGADISLSATDDVTISAQDKLTLSTSGSNGDVVIVTNGADADIAFLANGDTAGINMVTAGSTANISLNANGVNSDIALSAGDNITLQAVDGISLAATDDIDLVAYDRINLSATNAVEIVTTAANSTIMLTAVDDITLTATDDITLTATDDTAISSGDRIQLSAGNLVKLTTYNPASSIALMPIVDTYTYKPLRAPGLVICNTVSAQSDTSISSSNLFVSVPAYTRYQVGSDLDTQITIAAFAAKLADVSLLLKMDVGGVVTTLATINSGPLAEAGCCIFNIKCRIKITKLGHIVTHLEYDFAGPLAGADIFTAPGTTTKLYMLSNADFNNKDVSFQVFTANTLAQYSAQMTCALYNPHTEDVI